MITKNSKIYVSKKLVRKTISISIIAALLLTTLALFEVASAQMPVDLGVPHYFGPYPNYATSQLPTVTYNPDGSIASVTGGIKKFIDSLPGLGPANANNLGNYIPVAVADTATYSGSDYYEIAIIEFTQKMHTNLNPTKLRGYVQISTTVVPGLHVPLTFVNGTPIMLPNGSPAFGVDIPRYLGPTIVAQKDKPVRIKFYNLLPAGMGGDLFIPVDTTVMGAGMGPLDDPMNPGMKASYSENRAELHLHGGNTPWISDGTPHQWITPANEDTMYPKGVSVYNVPDMPDPGPGAMTFFYTNQQSARLLFYHDHSYGITRLNVYVGEAAGYIIRDTIEQALITSGVIPADEIPLVVQDKTFVPDNTVPYTNMWGTFASQLAFQDPTWSVTKYGGPGSLWYPHVYVPMQNPGDPGGMNLIGRWQYSPWFWPPFTPEHPPVPNPYYIGGPMYDPAYPFNDMEPPMIPGIPNPSMPGEAFMDTPVINGVAYPYLNVQPKAYRFRVLNAADDRAFNLQMYIADDTTLTWDGRANTEVKMVPAIFNPAYPETWPTDGREGGVPDPAYRGPEFIQIGTDAGFLPAPAVLPNQPVNWNMDQGTFDFAILNQLTLMLAPAERADVIVDFSQYAGKTIILYNDSPAPVPAADPRLDYYTGHPDTEDSGGSPTTIAGYGSNIRTVMQIRVAATTPAAAYNLAALNAAFASTPTTEGAFEASQKTIIVPQAAYSSAYNQAFTDTYGSIFATSMTFTPIGGSSPVTIPLQSKSIHDEMGGTFDMEYGRMEVRMGVEIPRSSPLTQTTILYGFADPPVDLIKTSIEGTQIGTLSDGTQIWRITHNGVDTHPMHWHMYDVQLINRVAWDNNIRMPDANELGWKDTIRVNPLQDTYIALRAIAPVLPFDLPNSIRPLDPTMPLGAVLKDSTTADLTGVGVIAQDPTGEMVDIVNHLVNFGWEYVWHCHILAHEEMDAMRPVAVGVAPRTPTSLTATWLATGVQLVWMDNSLSELQFTIQRANNAAFTAGLTTFTTGANINTYVDTTAISGQPYFYRVYATNIIGDTWDYNDPNINEGASFPTMTLQSDPSNAASPEIGIPSTLYMPMNEGAGSNINDLSGYGNNGVFNPAANNGVINGPATWVVGRYGQALTFNGVNNYVQIPDSASLDTLTGDMTISLWVNPAGTQKMYADMISKHYANGWAIEQDGANTNRFYFAWHTGSTWTGTAVKTTLTADVWQQLIIVKSGSTITHYLNGVQTATGAGASGTIIPNNYALRIGNSPDFSRHFAGTLDDVQVFNRALAPSEVSALYGSGHSAIRIGLVGEWLFDEGVGTNVFDSRMWSPGKYGTALSFNGVTDYVQVPDSASLDTLTGSITISLWVNPAGTQKMYADLISKHQFNGWAIEQDGANTNRFYFAWHTGSTWTGTAVKTTLTANTWQHFVIVKSGSTITHYLNGVQVATGTGAGATLTTNNVPLRIANAAAFNRQFAGIVDDVRIYNLALTPAQVTALYNLTP